MIISQELARDIVDPCAFAERERSDAAYALLRQTAPIARIELDEFAPFWAVTRFDDIRFVETGKQDFIVGDQPYVLRTVEQEEELRVKRERGDVDTTYRALPMMDDPDHKNHREILRSWFTPAKVAHLADDIRHLARTYVDALLAEAPEVDFARVTSRYALAAILEISGIPDEDQSRVIEMIDGLTSPGTGMPGPGVVPLFAYFENLTHERRRRPGDDMLSVLVNGRIDGELLTLQDLFGAFIALMTAGHDTTSASIASGAWALAERPALLERLRGDLRLASPFFEESIRWETPVKHFMRTAAHDVEIGSATIGKGDWIMLCYASGNRDEDRIADPFTFDIERRTNHLGFGHGPHNCIGQHLARLEGRLFWEELLPRLRSLELAGTPVRNESILVCGPKALPVRLATA